MLQYPIIKEDLLDTLDDFRMDGLLSLHAYRKKTADNRLLLAVNQADIECCGVLKPTGEVGILIPKNSRLVYIAQLHIQKGGYVDARPEGLPGIAWLHDEPYLDCAEISGSAARVVPVATPDASGHSIAVVSPNELRRTNQQAMSYEPDARIVRLNHTYEQDQFIYTEASLRPLAITLSDTPEKVAHLERKYTIRTPDYARAWLLQQCMMKLLPTHSDAYKVIQQQADRARMDAMSRKPGRPVVVYTPQGPSHYNF